MTDKPQTTELLPCPFCGDTPKDFSYHYEEGHCTGNCWSASVVCSCGLSIKPHEVSATKEEAEEVAIRRWNWREE